jgi:hypothetical protein
LKLTTTLPGHLFPGPALSADVVAAKASLKGALATVATAAVAAVLFRKERLLIECSLIISSNMHLDVYCLHFTRIQYYVLFADNVVAVFAASEYLSSTHRVSNFYS